MAASVVAGLLVVGVGTAHGAENRETNVFCPTGYQVGAYSRTITNGYQNHYYSDLNSDRIWGISSQSYIHASDSPFKDSYVNWYTANTFVKTSSRCA